MAGSAHQGRESIEELVQEEELANLSVFSYREGLGEREIIYEEDSTTEWIGAEYTLNVSEWL